MDRDKLGRFVKGSKPDINGKTYEEFYGKEKAEIIKKKFSLQRKGIPKPKVSESLKRLYSEGKLVTPMKNKHPSEITRMKQRKAHLGIKLSENHKKNIAISMGGRFWMDEEIEFLRENYSKKGNVELAKLMNRTPKSIIAKISLLGLKRDKEFVKELISKNTTGKIISDEHKRILSELKRGDKNPMKRLEVRKKMIESSKGKIISEITREKLRAVGKRAWENPEYKEKMLKVQRQGLRVKPNLPEKIMINLINNYDLNLIFIGDGKKWIKDGKNIFNPDFINEEKKKIVEVFGDYWHNLPTKRELDEEILKAYSKHGYETLVIWEHELIKNKKPIENNSLILNKIREFIESNKSKGRSK